MILVVDIGNSSITFGLFDGNELVEKFRMPSDISVSVDDYIEFVCNHLREKKLDGCIVASVVTGFDEIFKVGFDDYFGINTLILNTETPLDIKIKIDNPKELGADRIANAIGALEKFGENAIVVDFGTATTFEVVNKNHEFLGGLITTGLHLQLNALAQKTSKLPKIELKAPQKAIATNTTDAILSGIVLGNASMIDGMIKRYKSELAPEKYIVVATGGFAEFIESYMAESFDYIVPELTLFGLKKIYDNYKTFTNLL